MQVKYMFGPGASFGGGYVGLFSDWSTLTARVDGYLRDAAAKAVERGFHTVFGERLPENLASELRSRLPAEHRTKLDRAEVEIRFLDEPTIGIGKEKPLVITDTGFDANRIGYWLTMPIEARLKYSTSEGEVKLPGEPYQPPRKEEHIGEPCRVYMRKDDRYKVTLADDSSTLYKHACTNGDIRIVTTDS